MIELVPALSSVKRGYIFVCVMPEVLWQIYLQVDGILILSASVTRFSYLCWILFVLVGTRERAKSSFCHMTACSGCPVVALEMTPGHHFDRSPQILPYHHGCSLVVLMLCGDFLRVNQRIICYGRCCLQPARLHQATYKRC